MGKKSSIKTLPDKILNQVNFMLGEKGWKIDQVVAYLEEAGHPRSRSALGRYKQNLDQVASKLRESREITDALARELGDAATQGKQGRLLVEMARSVVFDLLIKLQEAENAAIDSKDVAMLGKGLAEMAKALRYDQDFETKIREQAMQEAKTQAADAAANVAQQQGLNSDQVAFLRSRILGVEVDGHDDG